MNYTTIESEEQYDLYCKRLRDLCEQENTDSNEAEMELIELLVEAWGNVHNKRISLDSISFLKALMDNHNLSLVDLENITGLNSKTVTQMLNYEIEIPEEGVKKLANRFNMREEAFANRRNV